MQLKSTASKAWIHDQALLAAILPVGIHVKDGRISQVEMTQVKPQYFEEIDTGRLTHAFGLAPGVVNAALAGGVRVDRSETINVAAG